MMQQGLQSHVIPLNLSPQYCKGHIATLLTSIKNETQNADCLSAASDNMSIGCSSDSNLQQCCSNCEAVGDQVIYKMAVDKAQYLSQCRRVQDAIKDSRATLKYHWVHVGTASSTIHR